MAFGAVRGIVAGAQRHPEVVVEQADPGAGNTGLGLASALLGLPSSVSLYQGNYLEAYANWAVYGEDEWKIRSNLTIDLGLRYDAFPPPNFIQGTINDWDANSGSGTSAAARRLRRARAVPWLPASREVATSGTCHLET